MMLKWRVYLALNHCEKKDQENCFAKKAEMKIMLFCYFLLRLLLDGSFSDAHVTIKNVQTLQIIFSP